jgi:glycosyltransferase involved in cell wall biosynthesis
LVRNLLFIQHGDYADAFDRFAQGGGETHRDQRETVEFVRALAPENRVITFAFAGNVHERELEPNLVSIATDADWITKEEALALIDRVAATHVILRSPILPIVEAAIARNLPMLPMFADTFAKGGPRAWWRNRRLSRALQAVRAPCVANHSVNAARSLVDVLGLPERQVIPWEHNPLPLAGPPKPAPPRERPFHLFFAGLMTEDKDVGDLLAAVATVRAGGLDVTLSCAGKGDIVDWRGRAAALGLADAVEILGLIPIDEVGTRMRAADAVVVPTRHSYAEGFPNTISEGIASGTPMILSDHPAFAGRIPDGGCLSFPAAQPDALARQIARLVQDPVLYAQISNAAEATLAQLDPGVNWRTLLTSYLDDPEDRTGWVGTMCLPTLVPDPAHHA